MTRMEACVLLAQDELKEAERCGRIGAHGCKMRATAFILAATGKRLGPRLEDKIFALMHSAFSEAKKAQAKRQSRRRAEYLRETEKTTEAM